MDAKRPALAMYRRGFVTIILIAASHYQTLAIAIFNAKNRGDAGSLAAPPLPARCLTPVLMVKIGKNQYQTMGSSY